ncbi:MAG TPA: anthranilate synthase component I family protein [Polyangia bacterium]|nr:anthranilate synthase component I family protein [Polyangia bacterium]
MIAVPAIRLAPDEAARRAAARPGAFWLSTPAPDEVGIARDIVGAAPVGIVRGEGPAELLRVEEAWRDARAAWAASGAPPPPGIPVAVGWFSYDLGRAFVGLPPRRRDDGTAWPAVEVHRHDAVWVRDAAGDATIFAQDESAARRLAALLESPTRASADSRDDVLDLGALTADHPDARFLDGVRRVLEYLRAGDAYQVNLSRSLSAPCAPSAAVPVALAAALRARAPAPHAAMIVAADGEGALVGNSPERFLAVSADGAIETRPIKGTRSRGDTPEADRAAAAALDASAKDRAEHVMIVDLERNDLGRVCRTGSVQVASLARVVALPTVFHMVSTVQGRLRPDVGLAALLEATFPGGSITGAPKRRAMQIIDELEPAPRGLYTGATGWLGAAGDLDLAIAIRTAVVRGGRLSLSVGGGVVADSTPEGELAETEVKARAFAALCGAAG